MQLRPNGSATLVVTVMVVAGILAIANLVALALTVAARDGMPAPVLATLGRLDLPALLYFGAAPLAAGVVLALLAARRAPRPSARVEPQPAAPASPPSPAPALRLLALLQQEARLIDFVTEEIDGYSDGQVGAAVRAIHAGCRKVLDQHVQLQRIFSAEDGSEVVVEKGFDPAAVRLTGNVTGEPPFRGVLQHCGWRAAKISLPDLPAALDPAILAPAEVEIG